MRLASRSLLLLLCLALASCGDEPLEWVQVWSDEFEGPAGQLPDPQNWSFDVGTGWGNAQLEYDTARAENVSLDGQGHLAITAREESYSGADYTSGRIKTQGLFTVSRPARVEARIRLPRGTGIWPAFWMLGADFEQVGWPECGEIDIMEYRGQEPSVVLGSLHGPGYSGGNAISASFNLPAEEFPGGFHVFSVQWENDRVVWEVDGLRYHTATRNSLPPGSRWVFDHPFFLILNVAVGGNFVGPPDSSTPFPQSMLVDWVRVQLLQ